MGRHVLASLTTAVVNDPGDPLLTAAILHWNAHHIPWTEAWWQLPIFYPTRDVMAFSEHLLGLSVLTAPLDWLTGSPLLTYNVTTLLTFPLSAAAMYLLVFRLTRSGAAACLAGLAFGFAPFRMSHLPHVQMLAAFWAPLALLGLHAFIESGRRRWLVLYGGAWLLQAAANGYALVYLSLLVGFWVLWFVVARRRWRDLLWIGATTVVAAVPLIPLLLTYIAVHARHGFVRGIDEIVLYSADVSAVLCATPALTFWGWVRVACRAEGELFPGVTLVGLSVGATLAVLGLVRAVPAAPSSTVVAILRRLLFATAAVYFAVVISVLVNGPWSIEFGFVRATAGSVWKPLRVLLLSLGLAFVLSPTTRASARRSSTLGFYLLAAVMAWLLALGPNVTYLGMPSNIDGPYAWLMMLPGADSLRVPARFWLITIMCLAIAAGLFIAEVLARRSRVVAAVAVVVVATGMTVDAWTTFRADPVPLAAPDPEVLRGQVVLELPMSPFLDIAAQWRAVVGGWQAINGYSGWTPSYYFAMIAASRFEDDAALVYFRRTRDLHVIVDRQQPNLVALVERQPGAVRTRQNDWALQYRLPKRPEANPAALGAVLPIAELDSPCERRVAAALDHDDTTPWVCPPIGMPQELTIDLGRPTTVAAFVQALGPYAHQAPRSMIIETSPDRTAWTEVFNGSTLLYVVDGALRVPISPRMVVPFSPHEARYLRVRVENQGENYHWTMVEAEVRAPAPAVP